MTSARTSGAIAGAAQGAATGAVFGVPGAVIGGAIGGIAGLISGSSADNQFSNQQAWAEYNRQSQYNVDQYNIQSSLAIAGMNASLSMQAANYNAQQVLDAAYYNANMIALTTGYNIELLDNELTRVWQDLDLDITQIEMFRARERSNLIADQSASGTVIGEGGNFDVIVDQKTQEAMDVTIIEFGADRQAANINNQIAQGRWEGEVAISQTMWEGEVQSNSIRYNSAIQSFGTVASAVIQADANMYSSKQAYMTGGYNIQQAGSQYGAQNTQNMVSGLFNAAGTAATVYYKNKIPNPGIGSVGSLATTPSQATRNYSTFGTNSANTPRLGNNNRTGAGTQLTLGLN